MSSTGMEKKEQLEQQYIQLLEKRIADLQLLTKAPAVPAINVVQKDTETSQVKDISSSSEDAAEKKQDEEPVGQALKQEEDTSKRVRNVVSKRDPNTGIRADAIIDNALPVDKEEGKIAFTFRRVLLSIGSTSSARDGYSEADVESKDLLGLLKSVIGDYSGQSWEGNVVNITAPFAPLVHFWDALKEVSKPEPTDNITQKQARQDLVLLLEHVKNKADLDYLFKTRDSNLKAGVTTFETMWSVFVPGQLVYTKKFLGAPQVFVVDNPPYAWDQDKKTPSSLEMDCWCYDWNGKDIVKVGYSIRFEKFRGIKPIHELVAYPTKYFQGEITTPDIKNEDDLLNDLVRRGIKFDTIVRGQKGAAQQFSYNGHALEDRRTLIQRNSSDDESRGSDSTREESLEQQRRGMERRRPLNIKGKYIVDPEAFLTYASGTYPLAEMLPDEVEDIDQIDDRSPDTKEGRRYLTLLPPRFLGYTTQEKFWGQFAVDSTYEVSDARKSIFNDRLQLDKTYKEMIAALVNEHQSKGSTAEDQQQVTDMVEAKGKGLVILLHGPPGVGKTLTAETIAEASGKPLFVVSVAEIGLDASTAEKRLEQMFNLAGKWEAVLLVDEADVFLESRTSGEDANRNALVSVLLRVLEYYQGIIILTTNRITSLDLAVQSRIHLAIRYADLTKPFKINIFKFFLDQLEPGCISDRSDINAYIDEYATEYKFNGRQIRNIVASALALARSMAKGKEGGPPDDRLKTMHLKRVINITKDFQTQLESLTTSRRRYNEVENM